LDAAGEDLVGGILAVDGLEKLNAYLVVFAPGFSCECELLVRDIDGLVFDVCSYNEGKVERKECEGWDWKGSLSLVSRVCTRQRSTQPITVTSTSVHLPATAMVTYNESERCAHLIGAVFTVVMLSIRFCM
jgi:hypothetical protein